MAIFRVRFLNSSGVEQSRLVEADWKAEVEREVQSKGYRLLAIEQVSTSTQSPLVRRGGSERKGFWTFRKFVTPSWICAVFITNVVVVVLGASVSVYLDVSALLSHQPGRFQLSDRWHVISIIGTIVIAFLYLFSLRIILECVIVLFRIYDELAASRRLLERER